MSADTELAVIRSSPIEIPSFEAAADHRAGSLGPVYD
jgi:hypothetical protein